MSGSQIIVDTQRVQGLAESVRRAEAEARALLETPDQLVRDLAATSPQLARAAAEFLQTWRQALADATDELRLMSSALDLAAQLYDTTQRVSSDRHGITLIGGLR